MSDFITRLVERALGLREVVQPVLTPIFGNELDKEDGFSPTLASEEEALDSEEETQLSEFPRTEASSRKVDIVCEPPVPNTAVHERPRHSNNVANRQPESKNAVVEQTGTWSESDPLASDRKGGEERFRPPKNPQSHAIPSLDRKAKEVISAPLETSGNIDLSEKRNTGTVKSDNLKASPVHSAESARLTEKPQDTDKQAHSLRPLAFERLIRPEVCFRQEQTGLAVQDHHSAEKEVSSPLPSIKVTIGRIDVRAVRQPAPSPPRQRRADPKPKLSLDDYLKQRNGGQR